MPSESQVHQPVDALAVRLEAFGFINDVLDLVRLELNVPERKPARSSVSHFSFDAKLDGYTIGRILSGTL